MGRSVIVVFSIGVRLALGWVSCMTFACSNLKQNACAAIGGEDTVNLANAPCDENYACKFQDLMDWYVTDVSTRTNLLPCVLTDPVVIGSDWPCMNRHASKNLASGEYPKECLSEADCKLQDGTANPCVCTPRTGSSSGYCKPDASSTYFQSYWDLCTLGGNVIHDEYQGYYWYLKTQFSVYYDVADLPTCKENLWEFAEFTAVQADIASAVGLMALASSFILAFI